LQAYVKHPLKLGGHILDKISYNYPDGYSRFYRNIFSA